jgi:hypothetical protein
MRKITATFLAHNVSAILDRLALEREKFIIERNHQVVARLVPGPAHMTALEAMGDLYRTLPEKAAAAWERDSRAVSFLRSSNSKS